MYALAAISIGLIGSLHCMGMCGPIMAAVSGSKRAKGKQLMHHAGRLITYMIFGATAGAIGSSVQWMGGQQIFSIVLGGLLVGSVLVTPIISSLKQVEAKISSLAIKASSIAHQFGLSKTATIVLAGAANGILPCGLVYMAVAGAANTFTPWDGALFMLIFGGSTLPALLFVGSFAQRLSPVRRSKIRKLAPIAVIFLGVLLMVRGMNLGIPFISPQVIVESNPLTVCHP